MGTHWKDGGYSATVEAYVLVDGRQYDVAEIGPESLLLRVPGDIRPGPAEIVIVVDGDEERHDVILYRCDPVSAELAYA